MRFKLPVVFVAFGICACSSEEAPVDKTLAQPVEAKQIPADTVNTPPPVETAKKPAKDTTTNAWVITPRGINWLEAGMSIAIAKDTTHNALELKGTGQTQCEYATLKDAPAGIWVMLTRGKIARVEVRSGPTATLEGARIGDTEDRLKEIYYTRYDETPHKYIKGGHYYTVKPTVSVDIMYRMVFETDGKTVTAIRSGKLPEVGYVEGCG